MITSAQPTIEFDATAVGVSFSDGMLRVKLTDGREIAAPTGVLSAPARRLPTAAQ